MKVDVEGDFAEVFAGLSGEMTEDERKQNAIFMMVMSLRAAVMFTALKEIAQGMDGGDEFALDTIEFVANIDPADIAERCGYKLPQHEEAVH